MDLATFTILAIFCATYFLILSTWIHRTTAAMIGAMVMIVAGHVLDLFEEEDVYDFMRWDILGLLLGMMIIVVLLNDVGFFRLIAKLSLRVARDRWTLILQLGLITGFLSMIVDNVTTILIVAPLTIAISGDLGLDPKPVLVAEVLFSNLGGMGTMVGHPPNLIIASYSDYTFNDFLFYLTIPTIVAMFICVVTLRFSLRKWSKGPMTLPKVEDPWAEVTDRRTFAALIFILVLVIALFVVHPYTGISPAVAALFGGALALVFTRSDPYKTLAQVEWPTLLFFAALFVLVDGLVEVGIVEDAAQWILDVSSGNTLMLVYFIFWFSLIVSAFIDNIPFTAIMAPLMLHIAVGAEQGALWWALALGVGLGSNVTPIAASSNIVLLGLAERMGTRITWRYWFRFSVPTTLLASVSSMLWLAFLVFYF